MIEAHALPGARGIELSTHIAPRSAIVKTGLGEYLLVNQTVGAEFGSCSIAVPSWNAPAAFGI